MIRNMIPPAESKTKKLLELISNPWIAGANTLFGIVSLPLAFYFYFAGIKSPDLCFYIHPIRSMIVSPEANAPLTVSYQGIQLKRSVFAVQCAIWNAGGAALRKEDQLKKFILASGRADVRLLDASIRKTSRDVIGFTLDKSALALGKIGIEWVILEKADGAVIQILYEGPSDSKFELEGSAVGQKEIRHVEDSRIQDSVSEHHSVQILMVTLSCLTGIMSVPIGIVFKRIHGKSYRYYWITQALMLTAFIAVAIYTYALRSTPFDF